MNIEKNEVPTQNFFSLSVRNRMEHNSVIKIRRKLFLEHKLTHGTDLWFYLCVTINIQCPSIVSLLHSRSNGTNHPHDPGQMVAMLMCQEDLMDRLRIKSCLFKLAEDSVSSTAVNQKNPLFILQQKASVKTMGYHGISGSQNMQIFKWRGRHTYTPQNPLTHFSACNFTI